MASKKKNAQKDGIHFVNARPTSELERLKAQRLVRAHVGRWISDQTRDRAEVSNPSRPNPPIVNSTTLNLTTLHTDIVDFDPSFSSFTLVSRPSPPSRSHARSPHARPRSASPVNDFSCFDDDPPDRKWSRSPILVESTSTATTTTTSDSDSSSTEETTVSPGSSGSGPSPPLTVEAQISAFLDPFGTYPLQSPVSPTLVDLCQRYCLDVLWPGIVPRNVNLKKTPELALQSKAPELWYSLSRSDPALFAAFMYASLCHQRVLWVNKWYGNNVVEYGPAQDHLLRQCERDSIRLINEALQDSTRMLSDAVLLSVICLAHHRATQDLKLSQVKKTPFDPPFQWLQWLNVYGCLQPNELHIGGLVELIKLRGLRNIKLPGLAATISFSEVFAAACWCIQPIFEFWPTDQSQVGVSIQDLLGFGPSDIQNGFGKLQVIGFTPQMAEAFQAARTYMKIVENIGSDAPNRIDVNFALLTDQRNLTEYTLLALPPASAVLPYFSHPTQATTYEACRLASLIFGVGVIFPIPAQNSPLQRLAQEISCVLLQQTATALWSSQSTRAALIWILVIGGIAAFDTPCRPFYVSSLASTARSSNIHSWDEVKCLLENILWYHKAGDKPGKVLWKEVEQFWPETKWETEPMIKTSPS
ncbi:uncharacterized protein N7483_005407 [Penicillium malachiteum]|uniref:uncharacterized protein n=1 Tax=Penicillium malachiteum TaxID=1324776 RepID=UPI0025468F97|nr:uncharacterized protein N7483_005407 [Penicillium malachiteum]KAJ5730899.1 hypothetical protein N7483_005407 [Penicillium malachiteum]